MPPTEDALCEATCNTTPQSLVLANITPDPLYFFNPANGEILECPPQSVAAFRLEAEHLNQLLDDLWRTQVAVSSTTQALHVANAQVDPAQQTAAQTALTQSIKAEDKAREAMFKELKDLPKFNDGAKGLMELLPLATHKGQKLSKTRRMTYVRSDKVKSHFRTYHDLPGDKAKLKSFYKKNAQGEYQLDVQKLKDSFSKVPVKGSLGKEDVTYWADGWAPEFAEAFNASYDAKAAKSKADKATPEDACVQFSGGASLMRFFAGVGRSSSAELSTEDLKSLLAGKGEIGAKFMGNARAGVDLASAQGNVSLYLPAKKGLHLHIAAGKNAKGGKQELELGYIRFLIEAEVSVTCGASALAEGGLEFKLKADMTQGVRGAPVAKSAAALADPKARVNKLEAENAAKGSLSAFAGAEAGGKVGGALQWQKAASTEFKDFAKVNAGVQGQAGFGGSAMFEIGYSKGKFRIKTKLAACVGLGIKGSIDAEVGVEHLIEFDLWFKHQVVNALDQNLRYFQEEAWRAFVYMKALAIAEGKRLTEYLGKTLPTLLDAWSELIDTAAPDVLARIKASRDYVLTSVAEAKALLLGLLESMKERLKGLRREIENTAQWLLSAAQSEQEIENIYARVAVDMDTKVSEQSGQMRLASLLGGTGALESIIAAAKTEPTPGYGLAFVNEPAYQFSLGMGTHQAWQRSPFGTNNNHIV